MNHNKKNRIILHCDMNSFYASVELLDYPELINKPVAVAGNPETRHGIILAKNEIAKKYGTLNDDKVIATINESAVEKDLAFAGYNLLVTSEYAVSDSEIYSTYHNLWRIEESFKIMKTQLEARPVYLQKENSIKGHFLICYISVLLLRLMQHKMFNNEICASKIVDFIRDFRVIRISNKDYINITTHSKTVDAISSKLGLPIDNYFLNSKQIKKVLSHKV